MVSFQSKSRLKASKKALNVQNLGKTLDESFNAKPVVLFAMCCAKHDIFLFLKIFKLMNSSGHRGA